MESSVEESKDLKEHMVGILFSQSKLTHLQKQVRILYVTKLLLNLKSLPLFLLDILTRYVVFLRVFILYEYREIILLRNEFSVIFSRFSNRKQIAVSIIAEF